MEDDREKFRSAILDEIAPGRERAERYRIAHGPQVRLTCPVCGTEDMGSGAKFWLFIEPGKTMSELQAVIPDDPDPSLSSMTHRCANGHRWRMTGKDVEGVIVWDRWERLEPR
jgi:hypothetical protein